MIDLRPPARPPPCGRDRWMARCPATADLLAQSVAMMSHGPPQMETAGPEATETAANRKSPATEIPDAEDKSSGRVPASACCGREHADLLSGAMLTLR
jgi:hypothetical protein